MPVVVLDYAAEMRTHQLRLHMNELFHKLEILLIQVLQQRLANSTLGLNSETRTLTHQQSIEKTLRTDFVLSPFFKVITIHLP